MKPCTPITDRSSGDTFAFPSAQIDLPTTACTVVTQCPRRFKRSRPAPPERGALHGHLPGRFEMRTRFVDYTGAYVVHCHILIHEGRGMMQLIEVVPDKPPCVRK